MSRRPIALPRAMALSLARARDERGWSQEVLARRVGVDHTVVSAWENGRRSPSLAHLIAWTRALDHVLTLTRKER